MNKLFLILFTMSSLLYLFNVEDFTIKNLNVYGKENNVVDHSVWDKLLKKYVSDDGDVNYKDFKTDAEILNNYINYLSTKIPTENWNKQEKMAYFINVYNTNTIKLIIDHYPIKSIKDIKNPWSKNRIKIGFEDFSLSDIENKILRKMNEPRIHFAINCASKSCPRLINKAFNSENVDALLDQAAKGFIADPEKNSITEHSLQLSKIFQWYKSDFTTSGSLIDYINHFSTVKIQTDASIKYLDYDWSLNEQH